MVQGVAGINCSITSRHVMISLNSPQVYKQAAAFDLQLCNLLSCLQICFGEVVSEGLVLGFPKLIGLLSSDIVANQRGSVKTCDIIRAFVCSGR